MNLKGVRSAIFSGGKCTGCAMCLKPCAPDAIVQPAQPRIVANLKPV